MQKSQQLQIRVTPGQKADLRRHARAAGLDVSSYVLARLLPPDQERFAGILRSLRVDGEARFALAELNDFLVSRTPTQFPGAVSRLDVNGLSPFLCNYVAAMVEQAAGQKGVAPPAWTREVLPLEVPYFTSTFKRLRFHLLRASPPAFKRRNLFVDSAIGSRV